MLGLISGFKSYAYIGIATAALSLVGYGFLLKSSNTRLKAENAALSQNLAARERQILQFKVAETVANANDERQENIEAKYNALIETIRNGEPNAILDAPLPGDILSIINGLHSDE